MFRAREVVSFLQLPQRNGHAHSLAWTICVGYCSVVVMQLKYSHVFYQRPARPRAELTVRKKSSCAAISLLLNICSAEASVTTGFWGLSYSQLILPTEYCSVIEHCNLQWIFLHKDTLYYVAQYNKLVSQRLFCFAVFIFVMISSLKQIIVFSNVS